MTCQALRDAIVERARGAAAGPGTAAAVESHLEACLACGALFEREQALSRALEAVAQSVRHEQGSRELEEELMAAFVEWHPSQLVMARRQLPETYRGWLAAAAGIVALAGAIAWSVAQPSETSSPATAPGQTTEKVTESLDGFVALPAAFGLPQFESGRIIRVDIPVASLPAYGVAVIPDTDQREVAADVLIGQDDQPRAIRLVSSEHQ